jgi:dynein heavy chain
MIHFIVSELLLRLYLDEYEETPWIALRYLIAGVMYGGHITDDRDHRLCGTYIHDFFAEESLTTDRFQLSENEIYCIPPDGDLQSYRDFINQLPIVDEASAFGQHANADIASLIKTTTVMLTTLVSLQPQVGGGDGANAEDQVLALAQDMETTVPAQINIEDTQNVLGECVNDPLNIVLVQEIERYNVLLAVIKDSLINLQKGIKGLVVMSSEVEGAFTALFGGTVPDHWGHVYPSEKPLGSWMRDLILRIEQLSNWAVTGQQPLIFWPSGFSFPTGFLTAVLQTCARAHTIPIDALSWEFQPQVIDDVNIDGPPPDGCYVKGLFLEGAGWDRKNTCLVEASPMQLIASLPTILFKPVENKRQKTKGMYAAPCYYFQHREGFGGAKAWSYVLTVDLKSGEHASEHWVKRATAVIMNLAD